MDHNVMHRALLGEDIPTVRPKTKNAEEEDRRPGGRYCCVVGCNKNEGANRSDFYYFHTKHYQLVQLLQIIYIYVVDVCVCRLVSVISLAGY